MRSHRQDEERYAASVQWIRGQGTVIEGAAQNDVIVPSATTTRLLWNRSEFGPGLAAMVNHRWFVIPVDGIYIVHAATETIPNGAASTDHTLSLHATGLSDSFALMSMHQRPNVYFKIEVTTVRFFRRGTHIDARYYQSSGSNMTMNGGQTYHNRFSYVRVA